MHFTDFLTGWLTFYCYYLLLFFPLLLLLLLPALFHSSNHGPPPSSSPLLLRFSYFSARPSHDLPSSVKCPSSPSSLTLLLLSFFAGPSFAPLSHPPLPPSPLLHTTAATTTTTTLFPSSLPPSPQAFVLAGHVKVLLAIGREPCPKTPSCPIVRRFNLVPRSAAPPERFAPSPSGKLHPVLHRKPMPRNHWPCRT